MYNLSGASASAREAFEHGLDLHSDEEDNAHLGSSPPGGSGRAARYRQQPSAFVDAHRYPGQEHQPRGAGDLLAGRGSERETVELLSLVELFPQADRTLVEEVPFCSPQGNACMLDRGLPSTYLPGKVVMWQLPLSNS